MRRIARLAWDGVKIGRITSEQAPCTIEINVSEWTHALDFYRAVFGAVDAPDWHGHSVNALVDSMVFGGTNGREPPCDIVIRHLSDPRIIEEVNWAREDLAMGRAHYRAEHGRDVEVSIKLDSQPSVQ